MPFGQTLREIRRRKNKTQRELADLLDLDYGYLSRLEGDKVPFKPSREFITKVVEKLECDENEKSELLMEAGRIDEEIEQVAQEANIRPNLREFFRSAAKLPDEDLEVLNQQIKELLQEKNK